MYKREPDDPDLVARDWNFLHINGCPIAPVVWGKLKFNLSNKCHQIFDEEYDVEKLGVDNEEKSIVTCVGKDGYCALLEFNKMNYAVLVNTFMYLRYDPPPTEEQTYQVHGTIKVNKILCVKNDEDHPKVMCHGRGNGFSQFRCIFAVSVFSPWIDVEVELFRSGLKIVDETIKLYCCSVTTPPGLELFPCQDERYTFGMDPEWVCHTDFFGSRMWTSDLNVKWSSGASPILQIDELKTALKSRKSRRCMKSKEPQCAYVEIFSVFIGGRDSSAPLAMCGIIVVQDQEDHVYIFSRSRKRPDKLLSSNKHGLGRGIMSLTWPDRWLLAEDMRMRLKLKDYQGNQVCRGDFQVLSKAGRRHDTRMCGFIKGKNGYFAAVHYSAFINGKKARVSVKWEDHHSIVVYGSIFTEYSNYDYPCTYDKEYYRSIIFNRSKEDGVKVKGHFEVPLSKTHVSAPSDCEGLIVYVKLWYRPNLGSFSEQCAIDTKLQFNASRMFATEQLGSFSVQVQWE